MKPMNKIIEIWKDLPGHEGCYQVSNIGRVRSMDYYINGPKGKRLKKGKIKEFSMTKDGYCRVGIWSKRKQKHITVHRLVALTFIPNPDNKKCVNHIDGDKTNNNVTNLEWCTADENIQHYYHILGGKSFTKGRNKPLSPAENDRTRKDRKPVKCIEDNLTFSSIADAARYYNISPAGMCWRIKNNYNKKEFVII